MLSSVTLNIPVLLAAQAAPTDSLNPLLLIVPIVLVLIALAGAGWYFMRQRGTPVATMAMDDEMTEPVRPVGKKGGWTGGKTTSAGMIAMLEILEGPEGKVDGMSAGRKIEIYSGRVRIGRSTELCDLQIYDIDDNSTVSRRHCTIEFDRNLNGFVIVDEGSRSGTRVGNIMIEPHQRVPLKHGDIIELGFVEQSGARLRFTSPVAKNARTPSGAPAIETASVEVRAAHGAIVSREEDADQVEPPPQREDLPGVETEVVHQHAPVSSLVKPGTGPLGQVQEPCDIFLSYSRKDRETMLRIRTDLRVSNISVWTDENLTPGTPLWRQAIENAIENACCIVIILSPDAKQSPWVQRELDYATTQDKPIIPLLVRGDERNAIPLTLISAQWADLRENYEAQFNGVLNIIKKTIEDTKTSSQ